MDKNVVKGVLLASFAGICWGSMSVAAQYLMSECGFKVLDLTSLRLFGAGVILVIADMMINGVKNSLGVFRKENFWIVLIYGFGLLASQATFFLSIAASSAATATIIVMTTPVFLIAYMALAQSRRIRPMEMIALLSALVGVVLILTKGDFTVMEFSAAGVVWGLVNAMCGAFCTIEPGPAIRRLSVSPVIGWGMTFSGLAACLYNNPFAMDVHWSWLGVLAYAHIVIFGTITAFWCYLKSMSYVSPSIASMLICFEPLSAVILSVVLLGVTFGFVEAIGACFIFATVVILARSGKQ
ncbi:MAG TPA: EamA family transporter [Candidatus Aphodousia gallistercoris]|nr:EamA family transporter [Candidatus Aphodousia gallistercoris]